MIMTRRSLFSLGAAALAGYALDPERALFVPGKKLISIPRPAPPPFFNVGDIIEIEGHKYRYRVKHLHGDMRVDLVYAYGPARMTGHDLQVSLLQS